MEQYENARGGDISDIRQQEIRRLAREIEALLIDMDQRKAVALLNLILWLAVPEMPLSLSCSAEDDRFYIRSVRAF